MPRRSARCRWRRGVTEDDRAAHRDFVATFGDKPIWGDFLWRVSEFALRSVSGLRRSLPLHVLTVQADKIDRIQHQRREAAIADRGCDDLTREREQQPWAFDHDQRMQIFLRDIYDPKHPGVGEIEAEHHLAGVFRLAFDRKRHFEFIFGDIVGADIDLDIDRRLLLLRRQRAGGVRIFERQVLGVLRQHIQLGRRAASGGAPLPLVMEVSPGAAASDEALLRLNSPVGCGNAGVGRVAIIAPPYSTRTTIALGQAAGSENRSFGKLMSMTGGRVLKVP